MKINYQQKRITRSILDGIKFLIAEAERNGAYAIAKILKGSLIEMNAVITKPPSSVSPDEDKKN